MGVVEGVEGGATMRLCGLLGRWGGFRGRTVLWWGDEGREGGRGLWGGVRDEWGEVGVEGEGFVGGSAAGEWFVTGCWQFLHCVVLKGLGWKDWHASMVTQSEKKKKKLDKKPQKQNKQNKTKQNKTKQTNPQKATIFFLFPCLF